MTVLVIDKDNLKMLTTADSITAFQHGERHRLTIYPKAGNYDHKIELPLEGSIRGSSIDKDNLRGTSSSATLDYYQLDAFKFLKVGDEIKLDWYPDTGIPFLEDQGLVGQKLTLAIYRKNGKAIDRLRLHLRDGVYSRSSMYVAMCQGFTKKVRETA